MKRVIAVLLAFGGLLLITTSFQKEPDAFAAGAVITVKRDAAVFAKNLTTLKNALERLQPGDSASRQTAIHELRQSRLAYKKIEAFMEAFFQ
jgi:hypothetical protein